MKQYLVELLAWAEPGYRYALETAAELAVLIARGVRRLGRLALAAMLFPPWLVCRAALWLWRRAGKGSEG